MEFEFFNSYTEKELKSLRNCLEETGIRHQFRTPLYHSLKNCLYKPYQLSVYDFDDDINTAVFTEPLIRMPLYLNDENLEVVAVAKWRLKLGR